MCEGVAVVVAEEEAVPAPPMRARASACDCGGAHHEAAEDNEQAEAHLPAMCQRSQHPRRHARLAARFLEEIKLQVISKNPQ